MKKEVKIGIYALLISLGAWAGVRFLSGADIFGRTNTYYVYYDNASGLQSAASVAIRGVKVGQVSSIQISEQDPNKVEVTLAVSKEFSIPKDSKAKIYSAGLMGGQAIEIVMGSSAECLEGGQTIAPMVELGMVEALSSEFVDIKQNLVVVMNNINTTLATLNSLVDDNSANVASAIKNLNKVLVELEESQIIANIDSFTGTLKNNGEKIDSIVTSVNNLTTTLDEQQMGVKLAQAVESLNLLLDKCNNSDGTVGSLLNDKELYVNLTEATDNLAELLEDLKQNPSRYVQFSMFGGKEKKAKTAK